MAGKRKRVTLPSYVQTSVLTALRDGGSLTQGLVSGISAMTKSVHHAAWIGSPTLDAMLKRGWIVEQEPHISYDAYYVHYQSRRFVLTNEGRAIVEKAQL